MRDEATAWQTLLALRRKDCAAACTIPPGASSDVASLVELYLPFAQLPAGRRLVVAHLGQSLDGRIATMAGASRWVTGEADLTHTHRMRALADAIIVGAGTVRHDDPQLRDEGVELLLNTAANALNGQSLGGLIFPQTARITGWDWQPVTVPERRIQAIFSYQYIVDNWDGYDVNA